MEYDLLNWYLNRYGKNHRGEPFRNVIAHVTKINIRRRSGVDFGNVCYPVNNYDLSLSKIVSVWATPRQTVRERSLEERKTNWTNSSRHGRCYFRKPIINKLCATRISGVLASDDERARSRGTRNQSNGFEQRRVCRLNSSPPGFRFCARIQITPGSDVRLCSEPGAYSKTKNH